MCQGLVDLSRGLRATYIRIEQLEVTMKELERRRAPELALLNARGVRVRTGQSPTGFDSRVILTAKLAPTPFASGPVALTEAFPTEVQVLFRTPSFIQFLVIAALNIRAFDPPIHIHA
jgi:hypothetical protein